MRLFTGLSLPPDASQQVTALIHRLRPLASLSWTKPEKLHVTTKFIGEWPESRLPELKAALLTVRASEPVSIHLRGIGWMPNPLRPFSVHADVEPTPELAALNENLEAALEPLGIAREQRRFRPHVTIARIRKSEPIGNLRREVEQLSFDLIPFRAESFILYLSDSGTYTKLEEYPLIA